MVSFKDVAYFYLMDDAPADLQKLKPEHINMVFQNFSLDIPAGVVSIIGPNGSGKSTLMLLAGARLFPVRGSIVSFGIDTAKYKEAAQNEALEEERNRHISYVYQNMEFEADLSISQILETILHQSNWVNHDNSFLGDLKGALELDSCINKKPQELSKGESQRANMAFAACYGSTLTIMDEPVFALEEYQKDRCLEYLKDLMEREGRSLYFSAHNIDLCQKYSNHMIVLTQAGNVIIGPTAAIATKENIEEAYGVPMDTLHQREKLYRDRLQGN